MSAGTVTSSVHAPCDINSRFPQIVAADRLLSGSKGETFEMRKTVKIIMAGFFYLFFALRKEEQQSRNILHVDAACRMMWRASFKGGDVETNLYRSLLCILSDFSDECFVQQTVVHNSES